MIKVCLMAYSCFNCGTTTVPVCHWDLPSQGDLGWDAAHVLAFSVCAHSGWRSYLGSPVPSWSHPWPHAYTTDSWERDAQTRTFCLIQITFKKSNMLSQCWDIVTLSINSIIVAGRSDVEHGVNRAVRRSLLTWHSFLLCLTQKWSTLPKQKVETQTVQH